MLSKYAALRLGLQLIEQKLAEAIGDPSLCVSEEPQADETATKIPTTDKQKRDRSAKVHPPRVIAIR